MCQTLIKCWPVSGLNTESALRAVWATNEVTIFDLSWKVWRAKIKLNTRLEEQPLVKDTNHVGLVLFKILCEIWGEECFGGYRLQWAEGEFLSSNGWGLSALNYIQIMTYNYMVRFISLFFPVKLLSLLLLFLTDINAVVLVSPNSTYDSCHSIKRASLL